MNKQFLLIAASVIIIGGVGLYYSNGGTLGKNLAGSFSSADEDSGSGSTTTSSGSTSTGSTSTTTTSSGSTTSAYKLYISSSSTKGVSYSVGQNDFQILYFGMRNNGTDDVQVTGLSVELTSTGEGLLNGSGTGTTANYSDLQIIDDTGAVIFTTSGLSTSGSDSVQTITFTGTLDLTGATVKKLYLTGDAANLAALLADTITPKIPTANIIATVTATGAAITSADIPTTYLYGKRNTCR